VINKVKNLFIYILCLFFYVFKGRADKFLEEGDFLVVQPAKLGDMICTTPVFRALKLEYPEFKVIVMGDKINKDILECNPYVDEYIIYDKSFWNTINVLKKYKIRGAFLMTPYFSILSMMYLSGINFIVTPKVVGGISPYMSRLYVRLSNLIAVISEHRMRHYAPGEYLNMLKVVGIKNNDIKKILKYSNQGMDSVLNKFNVLKNEDLFVVIAPGAGNSIKEWPADRFGEVANWILNKFNKSYIFIIGSSKDKYLVKKMMNNINNNYIERVVNTVGDLSIDELKALISKMSLFISADTGPIYIAEAFNIPTIDIVGPVDENVQPPKGRIHKLVIPKRTKSELYIMNARNYNKEEALRQVNSILTKSVIKEVNKLLNSIYYK